MTRGLALVLLLLGLAACADNKVVLLANDNGAPSRVVVSNRGGSALLDHPDAAVEIPGPDSAPRPITLSEPEIRREWADVFAITPPPPVTLRLYFVLDTTQLTPASETALPRILDLIKQRPAPEVVVIGNTDRSGPPEHNYELGLRRAEAVAKEVERIGVPSALVTIGSHGAGNPAVPNAKPYEPLNRRVEITVR